MKRVLLVLLATLTALISLGQLPANAQQKLPSYEKADCFFPQVAGRKVECGYLTVPEDRSNPNNGHTVKLAVAVFKSSSANPEPDPTIYLEGGPGGSFFKDGPEQVNTSFAPFLAKRDFVVFDQRGTGYSTPSLFCQEDVDNTWNTLGTQMTYDEAAKSETQVLQQCHDRLVKQGIDLSAYNSAESAADVADLRVALGYKAWNLYGISYGTRLALTVMRDHPEGIRSVILDSNIPPQIDDQVSVPDTANRVFKTFFAGCANSPSCNAAYPNLEKTFYALVDKLNTHPVTTRVTRPDNGKKYPMILTGDDLIGTLFFSFYITSVIPDMPAAITQAANGDYSTILSLEGYNKTDDTLSVGMYYSVNCAEEVSFDTPAALMAAGKKYPEQDREFDPTADLAFCKAWDVKGAPAIETKPVVSSLPSLVMEGTYDPITPPDFGKDTAKYLKNSFYMEFPGLGHGTSVSDECATGIALAFLDNPTQQPDSSCISKMTGPRFTIIDTSQFAPTQPPAEPPSNNSGGAA